MMGVLEGMSIHYRHSPIVESMKEVLGGMSIDYLYNKVQLITREVLEGMSIDYDRMRDYVVMMGEVVDIPIDSGYILIVEGSKEVLEGMLVD